MSLLQAQGLKRVLGGEGKGVAAEVLKGIDLEIQPGEYVSIIGPSGSGKSTLLYLLGLLDRPTEGEVLFQGKSIRELDDRELARIRNQKIGFIYQFHFLLPEFSALENVMLPMLAEGKTDRKRARERAEHLLELMDMKDHRHKRPNQLSGGQQQRVAVARALANQPAVVLADEPTGNLDTRNSLAVFDIFERLNREQGQTLVIVTHDLELARRAKRLVRIRDGRIVGDEKLAD